MVSVYAALTHHRHAFVLLNGVSTESLQDAMMVSFRLSWLCRMPSIVVCCVLCVLEVCISLRVFSSFCVFSCVCVLAWIVSCCVVRC